MKYQLYDVVYHRDVYDYKEPLKVFGITEDQLLLEGDFSGGTSGIVQRQWMNIDGVSKIYNYNYKFGAKTEANRILKMFDEVTDESNTAKLLKQICHTILVLTNEIK